MPTNNLCRGEQYDPDLGLCYLRARYYNPQTGRFMSRAPENGNGFNPKMEPAYPIAWISGHIPWRVSTPQFPVLSI